ncbi:MAG: glycosyltransferase family 2 protein [Flavisolibacter sp.]
MDLPVYIVIVNYREWQDVRECLESIFQSHYTSYKVIVVDNNSENNSLEHLMMWVDTTDLKTVRSINKQYYTSTQFLNGIQHYDLPELVLIQNIENRGFAAGNNVVLRQLMNQDAYIWLLNPDMVVEKNTLGELVRFANAKPRRSVIGAVVKHYSNPERVHFYGGARINFNSATIVPIIKAADEHKLDYIGGGSLFVHASHFRELGLLPENYFLYWEETDWCYNARQKGFEMLVCPTAICYDKISTSIGKSYLADYYYTLNGLTFISRYKKGRLPVVMAASLLRFMKRAVSGQWSRSKGVMNGIINFIKRKS